MKILIADDAIADSKALRSLFGKASANGGRGTRARKPRLTTGALVVALADGDSNPRDKGNGCASLDLADQPELAATIMDAIGMSLVNLGRFDEGGDLIKLALSIREDFFGAEHPACAASQNSYSHWLRETGDYAGAEAAAQEAMRINGKVYGTSGLPVATSMNELGVAQMMLGNYTDAEKSAINGLAILDVLPRTARDPNATRLRDLRGRAETELSKLAAASRTYAALLPLTERELGTRNHPKFASHVSNSGLVAEAQGNLALAEKIYREAVRSFDASLNGVCTPNLPDALANLGSLLREPARKTKSQKETKSLLNRALHLNVQMRGKNHPLVANDHGNVGRWLYDNGQVTAAKRAFDEAVRIYQHNIKSGRIAAANVFYAESSTWYGRIRVETGTVTGAKQAVPLLEAAIVNWLRQPGQTGTDGAAIASACLGRSLYLQNKDLERAAQLLAAAYPVVVRLCGPAAEFTARVAHWLKDAGKDGAPEASRSAAARKRR